jgi:branched-chain amino acid transport system ATP-binding protein
VLLEAAGLTSHYGRIPALKGIDLRIEPGELVALVGANGAGKTTLLRALSGVQRVTSGSVRFDGVDITAARPDVRVRLGIAQVPEGRQVFGPLSVEDNLVLGAYVRPAREAGSALERVYALFPVLAERRAARAGMLSGGQQQMLAIGRALMAGPRLLLLDEPSMGLAPRLVAEIFAAIRALREAGTTIFLVDQNARAALAIADRGYVLETGRIVLAGAGSELAANDAVKRAYLGL